MTYKILNTLNGANCGYVIEYNGQEYIADITARSDMDYRTEFAVFKSVDQQITFDNAIPIFRKMDVGMDFGTLNECIWEFIESINNKNLAMYR